MAVTILDGAGLAGRRAAPLARRAAAVTRQRGAPPRLVVLGFAGPDGRVPHVRRKLAACAVAGVEAELLAVPPGAITSEAVERLRASLAARAADGVFVQFPFPPGIDEDEMARVIPVDLDVDVMTPGRTRAFLAGAATLPPVTVAAALLLLDDYGIDVAGRDGIVIAAAGPFAVMLRESLVRRGARMSPLVVPDAPDLRQRVRGAQLVVVSAAAPGLVRACDLAPDTVAMDVGYFNPGGRGDIDTSTGTAHLHALAPVPGGIGPMTVSALIERVIAFAEASAAGGAIP